MGGLRPYGYNFASSKNILKMQFRCFPLSCEMFTIYIGRRQCVGETLARDTYFLFLTNIFQTFSISVDPKFPQPSLEPQVGIVLAPQDYHIILKECDP